MARRGIAARVTRIMPVLYSPLIDEHGEDGDDGLAEVDAGQAELGVSWAQPSRGRTDGGGRGALSADGQRDRGEQQPAGAGEGAQLGPLGVQRDGHASLRRSR